MHIQIWLAETGTGQFPLVKHLLSLNCHGYPKIKAFNKNKNKKNPTPKTTQVKHSSLQDMDIISIFLLLPPLLFKCLLWGFSCRHKVL